MFYQNARIFGADFMFRHGAFEVADGKFGAVLPEQVPADDGSVFELGEQKAILKNGIATLEDGTIACSAVNLYDCMVNAMKFGVPEEDAVRASTYNPACAIGAEQVVGSIETGKQADFLICSEDYRQRRVFLAGREIV